MQKFAAVLCVSVSLGVLGTSARQRPPREWRDYAGGPDSSRFVAATEIDKTNAGQLQPVWSYAAGQTDFNPIVAGGTVYGRNTSGGFVALDAATGKVLWSFQADGSAISGAVPVNGTVYWGDGFSELGIPDWFGSKTFYAFSINGK
jgi:glucose dehydrogenase